MPDLATFVSPRAFIESPEALIDGASACLDRFTDRFNACDAEGVDAELHFPHVMWSGASRLEWPNAGRHPTDFFDTLKRSGWHHTRYEDKQAALVGRDKVHFLVTYSRRRADNEILSMHTNLWMVVRIDDRWGICLRSY